MNEKLKSIGQGIMGLLIIVGVLTLIILALHGVSWLSEKVIPILMVIVDWTFIILLLLGLPLSFFRRCKGWCGLAFFYWSYLIGIQVWMVSLMITLMLWGWWAVIIGLFMAGVGIFPIAIIASAFHREWGAVGSLVINFSLLVAARIYGLHLLKKAEDDSYLEA